MNSMKRFMKGSLLVILLCAALPAQAEPVSTVEVLKRMLVIVAKIEDAGDQVLFIQIDNLNKGYKSEQTYTLGSGSEYGIVAVGDEERIQDIDLKVYNQGGDLVGKDGDDENIAVVSVESRRTQKYHIEVSAYKMSTNDGFYGIIIFRND